MKKIIYFLILLLIPISVNASYGIENYRMDITVLENGDIKVLEAFEMNGTYNGFERIVNYKSNYDSYYGSTLSSTGESSIYNGSGITLNEIRGINFDINTPFEFFIKNGDLFKLVDSASKGDYGVYVVQKKDVGETYTIYNHSKMNKDFYLSYTLENMAIVHQDIAELGLNVFTEMNESIGNLEIFVHIPTNKNLLRVWGHGPLNGVSQIIDSQTVKITIEGLESKTAIDFRLAFDKEAVDLSSKTTNIEALDNIFEIETRLADEANEKRDEEYNLLKSEAYSAVEKAEKTKKRTDYDYAVSTVKQLKEEDLKYELQDRLKTLLVKVEQREFILKIAFTSLIFGWTIGLFIILINIYLKHDKEYRAEFNNKYYRDFPATYGPATVGYLIRKKVNNNDLSASILNLINMKVISYTSLDEKNKDFKFTKLEHKLVLSEADERLIKFLFDEENEISLSELKKKANKNYESFITNYSNWINRATMDAEAENFYEDILFAKLLGTIYSIIGIIIGFLIIEQDSFITPIIMIFFGIIALIYCISFTKRTKKGNEDKAKWLALKKFMEDFGTMDDKELPQITLWEKYLVYAVTLGCADKLSKAMKLKIQNMNMDNQFDINYFDRVLIFNHVINSSVNNVVQAAYSAKSAAVANSVSSSGGGFGGGFSGGSFGGGSFGGGGGGGRF